VQDATLKLALAFEQGLSGPGDHIAGTVTPASGIGDDPKCPHKPLDDDGAIAVRDFTSDGVGFAIRMKWKSCFPDSRV